LIIFVCFFTDVQAIQVLYELDLEENTVKDELKIVGWLDLMNR
jgi:hypothetical protein